MNPLWETIIEIREVYRDQYWTYYLDYNLFSFGWWVILATNGLFIFLAWKLLDRSRLFELFTVGGWIAALSTMADSIGVQYVLFAYPISLTPVSPSFFVTTYIVIPVTYMLLYQYFSTWRSFSTAVAAMGIVYAFGVETLFRWLNIYEYIHWNAFYSLLVYFSMGVLVKWIMEKLKNAR
jgi:hypothetical protein